MPKIDIRQCLEFTFFLVSPSKIIRQIQNIATSKLIITFHVPQSHFQRRSNCDELVSHLCSHFRVTRIVNKLSNKGNIHWISLGCIGGRIRVRAGPEMTEVVTIIVIWNSSDKNWKSINCDWWIEFKDNKRVHYSGDLIFIENLCYFELKRI